MIPMGDTLVRYDNPISISKNNLETNKKIEKKSQKRSSNSPLFDSLVTSPSPSPTSGGRNNVPDDSSIQKTQDILNAMLPPREWIANEQQWIQHVSSTPATRSDVVNIQELLDKKLQQRQARETGICPVRRELYSQCFDELIRQVTINCAERGLLLLRVRDEIRLTLDAYQVLYESSVAFGMRKCLQSEQGKVDMIKQIEDLTREKAELERQVAEEKARCEQTERRYQEQKHLEEKKHSDEVQFLKKINQQLKVQLEGIIAPKKQN
ncbi:hypothetical protein HELRODRAFT_157857 [Helobdella robusta]|uniref:Axonemal dynein light intermediate polypeptide 1 n=1 Tax=Helobdella robusta TaxID=6412 RepID=T1EMG9_HELRO|nr:hypothetical protein HELRODRAFT_157857 [Helobdella robusta]ESN93509.1 hypothetical protein HELRODRAFT_157857 [Helobdella robusta]